MEGLKKRIQDLNLCLGKWLRKIDPPKEEQVEIVPETKAAIKKPVIKFDLFRLFLTIVLLASMVVPVVVYPSQVLAVTVPSTPGVMGKIDYYESGTDSGSLALHGNNMHAQTFQVSYSYNITEVRLYAKKDLGSPGIVTVNLTAADPSTGKSTAPMYRSVSVNATTWNTTYEWRSFPLAEEYYVTVGQHVGITIQGTGGDASNYAKWAYNSSPLYADGSFSYSNDGGVTWDFFTTKYANDGKFQVWGYVNTIYPQAWSQNATSVTSTSAYLSGNISYMGDGASTVDAWFDWGYSDHYPSAVFPYTTGVTQLSANGTFESSLGLPVGGRDYMFRAHAENDLGNSYYENSAGWHYIYTPGPPTTIAENIAIDHQGMVTHVYQRKTWYAAGRYWIATNLYRAVSMGTPISMDFYYTSSTDGLNWDNWTYLLEAGNNPADPDVNESDELNVYFDGTYLHVVYIFNRTWSANSNDILYWRGIPQSNGTVSWSTANMTTVLVTDETRQRGYPSIMTDTSGKLYITYYETASGGGIGTTHIQVIKNNAIDGTWSTASGYPITLSSPNSIFSAALLQLTDNKMMIIGTQSTGDGGVYSWLYDGASWGSRVTIDGNKLIQGYRFSAVARGDVVHLAYMRQIVISSTAHPYYTKYDGSSWTGNITSLYDTIDSHDAVTLSVNGATDDVYAFWTVSTNTTGKLNHIMYKMYDQSSGSWGSAIDWINEEHHRIAGDGWGNGLSTHVGSDYMAYGGQIGVYYVTGGRNDTEIPYDNKRYCDLRFAYLSVDPGPAVRTDSATNIAPTSVTLNGKLLNDGGQTCSVRFDWGPNVTYPYNTSWQSGKTTNAEFEAYLSTLTPNTQYYYRAVAKWVDGTTSYGDGVIFNTTSVGPPTITTNEETGVSTTTATLQGTLNSLGGYSPVYAYFSYGTTAAYGTNTTYQTKTSPASFPQGISGLTPNTLYHFRAVVKYDSSYVFGADNTFTTSVLGAPTVTTDAAGSVTASSAILQGTLNSLGDYTTVYTYFEYGTTAAYGTNTTYQTQISPTSFSQPISSLTASITYHFRAVVKYGNNYVFGNDNTFSTSALGAPTITTGSAASVVETTATLQGTLTSLGDYSPVYVLFEYGTTTAYGTNTTAQTKIITGAFSEPISGLISGQTYHFRAKVKYDTSYVNGVDNTFTTTSVSGAPSPPTLFRVSAYTADNITLSWTRGGGATNTVIRYSTTAYPASPAEGSSAYSGVASTYIHEGLVTDTRYYYSAWSETSSVYSTTYATVSGVPTGDDLSQPDSLTIETAQVYRNYIGLGDQLFVFSYEIGWDGGSPMLNPADFFYIQILEDGAVKKQDRIRLWGYAPGSLYISSATALIWGEDYTIRIIGVANKWTLVPETSYILSASNYMGSEYNSLSTWCMDLALRMEISTYYSSGSLVQYTDQGKAILSGEGARIFQAAIPNIANRCPELFYPTYQTPEYVEADEDLEYAEGLQSNLEINSGNITYRAYVGIAEMFGVPVDFVAAAFWFFLYALAIVACMLVTRNLSMSLIAGLPILFIGTQFGAIPMIAVVIAALIAAFGIFYMLWFRTA